MNYQEAIILHRQAIEMVTIQAQDLYDLSIASILEYELPDMSESDRLLLFASALMEPHDKFIIEDLIDETRHPSGE